MHVSLLSKDYLSPAGIWKRILADRRREAPAVFKHQNKYYLITSLCSGWDPNPADCAVADSMLGEWRQQGNPCKGPDAATTFHSQSTYVLPLQPEQGKFLFMADRWNKTDLEHSGYCWLPLQVRAGVVEIRNERPDSIVLKKITVTPLSILDYTIRAEGAPDHRDWSFIRFYDSSGRRLLEYAAGTNNYTEAPPHSAFFTVGYVTTPGKAIHIASCETHIIKDPFRKLPTPLCDLGRWMRPFWRSDTIFNETVLMTTDGRGPAGGRLLYEPDRVLSVTNYGLDTVYRKKHDYIVKGRSIYLPPGSSIPYRKDTPSVNLGWYDLQSRWITVTYTHHDPWTGPTPSYKGDPLARTTNKLRSGAAVTIVAYGTSITRGMDVSGYDSVRPFMPSYMDLWSKSLQDAFPNSHVTLHNAALPGATIAWGAEHAEHYVAPLHPDLTVIDFGMNDFWSVSPEAFRDSVKTIIRKVRAGDPAAAFLLLANMQYDPAYVADTDRNKAFFTGNFNGYRKVLQEMEGPGIACLDMTSLSAAIYRRKKAKDCLVNPLHPNDYLARWYAQGLLSLFIN
jgi:hypothetical protein